MASPIVTNNGTTVVSTVGQATGDDVKQAQPFTMTESGTPTTLTLNLKAVGAVLDSEQFDIFASDGTKPTGSSLGTTSVLGSSMSLISCTTSGPLTLTGVSLLTAGNYFLVMSRTGALNDALFYRMCGDTSPNEAFAQLNDQTTWDTAHPFGQGSMSLAYTTPSGNSNFLLFM